MPRLLEERLVTLEGQISEMQVRNLVAERRLTWWRYAAMVLGVLLLTLLPLETGQAAGSGASPSLVRRVRLLETQLTALQTTVTNEIAARVSGDVSTLASANNYTDALASYVDASYATKTALSQEAALRVTGDTLNDGTEIRSLLPHFSRDGNNVYITGANLHLRNGTDSNSTDNSTGNLYLGYGFDEAPTYPDFGHSHSIAAAHDFSAGRNASVADAFFTRDLSISQDLSVGRNSLVSGTAYSGSVNISQDLLVGRNSAFGGPILGDLSIERNLGVGDTVVANRFLTR